MIKAYLKPTSTKEAVLLKNNHKNIFYIGGGTWVNSSYSKLSPDIVVSLSELGLNKITKKDNMLIIGSGITMQEIIDNKEIPDVLKESAKHIGSRNIRNMATLGGSIGAGSPWFSLTPALLVLGAVLVIHNGKTEKEIPLYKYIEKDVGELILAIKLPLNLKRFSKVLKYTRTARTVPVIVAAVSCEKDGNKLINPLIAIGGVADKVVLLKNISLIPQRDEIEKKIAGLVNPKSDFRAGAKLRKYMAGVLVADCFDGVK